MNAFKESAPFFSSQDYAWRLWPLVLPATFAETDDPLEMSAEAPLTITVHSVRYQRPVSLLSSEG